MKTKAKRKLTFTALPRDYVGLCSLLTPRRIRDKTCYDNTVKVADAMAVHVKDFSKDQEDYFDVLCMLIEVHDAEHVKWPKLTPLQRLKYLLEQASLSGVDLSRILGASRILGPMILRGEREITAGHARALGAHFGLPAGAFIETLGGVNPTSGGVREGGGRKGSNPLA